jgi:hypothetical protein
MTLDLIPARRCNVLLLHCSVIFGLAGKALAAAPTIPTPFQGRWSPSLVACASAEGTQEIRITPHRLNYYESTDEPIAVLPLANNAIRIRARHRSPDAEFEKPMGKDMIVIRLLAGGKRLSYQLNRQRPLLYVRCKTARLGSN